MFVYIPGEVATARAAASCSTIMVLSFTSSSSIEEVAASSNAVRFYQLYVVGLSWALSFFFFLFYFLFSPPILIRKLLIFLSNNYFLLSYNVT